MKLTALIIVALLAVTPAAYAADGPFVYEFEFGYKFASQRLMFASCDKVVPLVYVQNYAVDPRPGWTVSCGGSNPVYTHFLGRRCAKPLPRLVLECGWRHMSHAGDSTEITYDAIAVRGRFTLGKR